VLRLRVATALVLLFVLVGALAWSAVAFGIVAAAISGAAVYEWLRLCGHGFRTSVAVGVACALLGALAADPASPPSRDVAAVICGCGALAWIGIGIVVLRHRTTAAAPLPRALTSLLGALLLAAVWSSLRELLRAGPVMLVSAMALVWIADIAAYFAGRAFGRRKMAPAISPGKTWAGAAGALVAVWMAAVAVRYGLPSLDVFSSRLVQALGLLPALLALAVIVALAIVGDLFESLLKRQAGVKDSSRLLPGHGGVLDRIDALLPVLPCAALVLRWL